MADPVQDGEPVAYKRDVLVPGNIFAVGVADEQVHRFVLDQLMQIEQVAGALDVDVVAELGRDFLIRLVKALPGVPVTI